MESTSEQSRANSINHPMESNITRLWVISIIERLTLGDEPLGDDAHVRGRRAAQQRPHAIGQEFRWTTRHL